jgi:hypothetical protein
MIYTGKTKAAMDAHDAATEHLVRQYLSEHPGARDMEIAMALGMAPVEIWHVLERLGRNTPGRPA